MNRSNDDADDRSTTAGADFLQLRAADAPAGGLSDWLAGRLRLAIADGRLPVGGRLPPSRVLAGELRVSRGVVTEAYRRLAEGGHVAGRGRAGTVVLAAVPAGAAAATSWRPGCELPSPEALFGAAPGVDVFDALRAAPARVDLSPGVPDLAAFPRAAWLRAERAVFAALPADGFGYGDPRGTPELRLAITHWLARNRGISAHPDEVVVVAGTAQTLTLLAGVLRAHGIHEAAVEDPGSLGVRQHLRNGLLATPPVPVDAEGISVEALRATGARAVVLTPAHQFPTGVVLSGARRRELMRWAADGGLVVEDDYDAEHRYDRPPVPALRSVLADRVVYAGSVSKLLAPALRIGWVLAPPPYREALVAAKRFTDLGNAVLPQLVLARLMESGALEGQLRLLRTRHRRRRDAMIEAIGARLPGAVVHGAAAGLHLTVTFEADASFGAGSGPGSGSASAVGFADTDLAAAALARGVKVHPLSWHRQVPGPPGLVLGYAANPPDVLSDAVAVLAAALHDLGTGRARSRATRSPARSSTRSSTR